MAEWWETAPLVAPPPRSMASGPVTIGTPKKPEPKAPIFVPEKATRMYDPNTQTFVPVPKDPTAPDQQEALKNAIAGLGLDELLGNIQRARTNLNSPWASGTMGAVAEMKPGGGTPRDNFLGNLTAVKGGVITEKLQSLKEASKTGASGFGSLSEKEGALLASSLAALTENMSPDEYDKSFRSIARHAYTLQAVRNGLDPTSAEGQRFVESSVAQMFADSRKDTTAPGGATAPSGGGKPSGGGDGGGGAAIGAGELTSEQQRAYTDFWTRYPNATPEQLTQFFSGIGLNVTNAKDIIAAKNSGRGISSATIKTDYQTKVAQEVRKEDEQSLGDSPLTTLTTQGATLNLSDEAAGVGKAAANVLTSPFTGNFNPLEAYSVGRDAERLRIENAREQLGYGSVPVELISGLAAGGPAGALANITTRGAIGAGVTGGALAGFGSGEGAQDSLTRAAAGGVAGGALAYAAPALPRLLPRRLRSPQGMAPDVARAAQEEGVDLIRPMVDPQSRTQFSALESREFSQPIIRQGVERTQGQMAGAAERLGQGGTAMEPGAAGEVIQTAGRRFIQRSRNVADRLYNRARSLAGDTRFEPTEAIAQVDAELAQLQANPETNAGEIGFLEGLRRDLTTAGGKTVEELRQLRTSLRGRVMENNLTATQAEARAIRAMDATQQDVAREVPAAASAFRRADTYYRERQTHIDDIIQRVTGGRVGTDNYVLSGEQALSRIKSMASPGGDGRRLAALMRDLTPNERQDIAATFAAQIGRRAPDEPFSAALFLQQTRALSPSARRTIFGPDGARSIQNLRTLSQALKDAGQDINYSRSGTLLERAGWRKAVYGLITSLTGLGGGAMGGVAGGAAGVAAGLGVAGATTLGTAITRRLSARAMVNPRVTMWLAEAANVSSRAQAQQSLRRLGTVIAREPALAAELQPLHDLLSQRITPPLAAQGTNDDEQ